MADILAEVISRVARAFFRHRSHLTDDARVSFVVWQPPAIDFGLLPRGCQCRPESGRNNVSDRLQLADFQHLPDLQHSPALLQLSELPPRPHNVPFIARTEHGGHSDAVLERQDASAFLHGPSINRLH